MSQVVFRENCLLTMGVFDVFHRGHQNLLLNAKDCAKDNNLDLVVMTFSPHPTKILLGEESKKLVCSLGERIALLEGFEPKKIIVENFTKDFSNKTPNEFMAYLSEILPNLKHIVIGDNFKFGKGAIGDVKWINDNAKNSGISVNAVEGIKDGESLISSTRIRAALSQGDVETFYALVNRDYAVTGKVQRGNQLGRKLGFPTLNLDFNNEFVPSLGVYVSRTTDLKSGKIYESISSLGLRPTIKEEDKKLSLETHILSTTSLGYSSDIKVELLKFIRPEKKFDNIDNLCDAIGVDKREAIGYFRSPLKT